MAEVLESEKSLGESVFSSYRMGPGIDLRGQVWQQRVLPAEPSCQPLVCSSLSQTAREFRQQRGHQQVAICSLTLDQNLQSKKICSFINSVSASELSAAGST